ncbi:hypothetical protein BDZ89DRAFT_1047615 [Hymenopellis radicata]|nr:hypothetical protein BDZ89DRAFT_1047615 [Hymenopellis radicata]
MPRAKEILTLKALRKRTPYANSEYVLGLVPLDSAFRPGRASSRYDIQYIASQGGDNDEDEVLFVHLVSGGRSGLGQDRFANRIEVAIDRTPPSFTSTFFRKNFMMRDPPVRGISMPAEFKTFWSEGHTQATSGMAISSIHRYRRGHLNAGRADDKYLVWEDLGHSCRLVHPSLDYDSKMALRENESALLYDLYWSQDPFDGATDLPLVNVRAQEFEIGYNRFIPKQLRCANNCSSDWGSLFDDAMRSRNLSRLHLRERQLHFEINRRWPIPAGPHKAEQQTIRLRLRSSPHQPRSPVPPASAAPASSAATSSTSSSFSSGPVRYTSRVLPALDAEMEQISGLNDPSVILIAARLECLERFPVPADSHQPFYLRNPRIAPYSLPVPSRPSQSHNSQEENTRLLNDAMAPQRTTPAIHHSSPSAQSLHLPFTHSHPVLRSNLNALERITNRFWEVIAEELRLVSNWEDEYLANAREDKKLAAEVAELLHGHRLLPSPPPSPRHEQPYFISSARVSGLRALPTTRIGPVPPQSRS